MTPQPWLSHFPLTDTAPAGTVVRCSNGWVFLCDTPRGTRCRWLACGMQQAYDLPAEYTYQIIYDPRKDPDQ